MKTEKQLELPIDYSKIAVAIFSNDADFDPEYDDFMENIKSALEKQLSHPKQFIEEHHEDDFGHTYITGTTGPKAYGELKKKWSRIEFLITCIYFDESVHGEPPSAQDFHLYKVEKDDDEVEKLVEVNVHLLEDLEDDILKKWQDDEDFKICLIDNGISLHLLEDIMPRE